MILTQSFFPLFFIYQAVCYLDEYNEMLDFIVRWSEKAKSLLRANIIWNSSVHLQEQIRMYQVCPHGGTLKGYIIMFNYKHFGIILMKERKFR